MEAENIKVSDLRIGNYISVKSDHIPDEMIDQIFRITSITETLYKSKTSYSIRFENSDGESFARIIDQIKPIEISYDLLTRCGFIRRSENHRTMMLPLSEGDPLSDPYKDTPTIQWWSGNDYMSVCRLGISAIHVDIGSVHQLQNLYYSLTGKELKIFNHEKIRT